MNYANRSVGKNSSFGFLALDIVLTKTKYVDCTIGFQIMPIVPDKKSFQYFDTLSTSVLLIAKRI